MIWVFGGAYPSLRKFYFRTDTGKQSCNQHVTVKPFNDYARKYKLNEMNKRLLIRVRRLFSSYGGFA